MYITQELQDTILSRLSGDKILDLIGESSGQRKKYNGKIICKCPLKGHLGDRDGRNFAIQDAPPFRYNCSSHCGGGNLTKLMQIEFGFGFVEAWSFLANAVGINMDNYEVDMKRVAEYKREQEDKKVMREWGSKKEKIIEEKKFEITHDIIKQCKSLLNKTTYHTSRKIDDLTADMLDIGYITKRGEVVEDFRGQEIMIPLYSVKNEPVAIIGRDITGKMKPKYMYYPAGVKLGLHLFNLNNVLEFKHITNFKADLHDENYVVLVEGCMDAIRLMQLNIPCVAYLGSRPTLDQLKLLKRNFTTIYIATDNDKTGNNAYEFIYSSLSETIDLFKVDIPYGKKDLDECSDSEIRSLIGKARKVN